MKKVLALAGVAALGVGAFAQFTYSGPGGSIPDGSGSATSGTPFVSTVNVTTSLPVLEVWVSFEALAHTWVGDVHMTLTAPNMTTMHIMSRPGRGSASTFGYSSDFVAANSYTFRDGGVALFNVAPPAIIPSGIYEASSNPNPPATNTNPYSYTPTSFIASFGGINPQGIWTLEVTDWAGGDTGSIGSWTLHVDVVPEPATLAAVGLGLAALAARRRRK